MINSNNIAKIISQNFAIVQVLFVFTKDLIIANAHYQTNQTLINHIRTLLLNVQYYWCVQIRNVLMQHIREMKIFTTNWYIVIVEKSHLEITIHKDSNWDATRNIINDVSRSRQRAHQKHQKLIKIWNNDRTNETLSQIALFKIMIESIRKIIEIYREWNVVKNKINRVIINRIATKAQKKSHNITYQVNNWKRALKKKKWSKKKIMTQIELSQLNFVVNSNDFHVRKSF